MSKTPEEVLFPEVKIGEIVVKPWNFGILFDVSSAIERILDKMDEKGVSFENIVDEYGIVKYQTIARLFSLATDDVFDIISITTGVEKEELKDLPMKDGIHIALTIYKQNKEVIKNALALGTPQDDEEVLTEEVSGDE